jgi:prepilin-type N-terminal cleavage/methylation domain-containing protein
VVLPLKRRGRNDLPATSSGMTRRKTLARWRDDRGFTIVELLTVLAILASLFVLTAPSYLGARDRATAATAKSSIRAFAVAAEMFALDNAGAKGDADGKKATSGFKGMTIALLRSRYDPGLPGILSFNGSPKVDNYCVVAKADGQVWSARGPGITADKAKPNGKCK